MGIKEKRDADVRASAPQKQNGDKSPPVWSKRLWTGTGSLEVAIFRHTVQGQNGDFTVFSTSAKRSWKQEDEYKEGRAFRPEGLLPLAYLLNQAFAWISDQPRE